jgi:hypothetical protein
MSVVSEVIIKKELPVVKEENKQEAVHKGHTGNFLGF